LLKGAAATPRTGASGGGMLLKVSAFEDFGGEPNPLPRFGDDQAVIEVRSFRDP
jgi:hypothetical protein